MYWLALLYFWASFLILRLFLLRKICVLTWLSPSCKSPPIAFFIRFGSFFLLSCISHLSFEGFLNKKKQGQDISFLQIPPKVQPLWQYLWLPNRITMWLCITWIYFENNDFVYSPDKGLFVEAFFLKLLQSFHQLLIRSHFSPQLLI